MKNKIACQTPNSVLATRRLLLSILAFTILLLQGCSEGESPQSDSFADLGAIQPALDGEFAFVNVSVVPMTTNSVLNNQTLLIDRGHIRAIGPTDEIDLVDGVKTIDGTGRFLAPGLADMHVHLTGPNQAALTLTYGVTTVRHMGACDDPLGIVPGTLDLIGRITSGEVLGPNIVTAGPIVDGAPKIWSDSVQLNSVEEAVNEVRAQLEKPYDFIKVYSLLPKDIFFALAEEANRLGRPFAGHLPIAVTIREALDAGMSTMEHMIGFDAETVVDGVNLGYYGSPQSAALGRSIASGATAADSVFDAKKMAALAREVAASDTWVVPTLTVMRGFMMSAEDKAALLKSPQMAYVSPMSRKIWIPANDYRISSITEEDAAGHRTLAVLTMGRVKTLHDAGAKLLIGTDAPSPFVFDGLSVHEEMDLFIESGVPVYDTIRAATAGPAEALRQNGKWGTVAPGARADLVLLKDNPLADVEHYRAIEGVMVRGQWLDKVRLDEIRAETAAAYEAAMEVAKPRVSVCAH